MPGSNRCDADLGTADVCSSDGTLWIPMDCDPLQGMVCDEVQNQCVGACTPNELGQSYIGCDYYPTQLGNIVHEQFAFAIAVSNTSDQVATLTAEGGEFVMPVTAEVEPGAVHVMELPWVEELKMCMGGSSSGACGDPEHKAALKERGAYRVRSTEPVTMYQFSPLDYERGGVNSFTNDASLLLPTNSWTGDYVAGGWRGWTSSGNNMPSLLAVTASSDNTEVTITSRSNTEADNGAPAFLEDIPQTVTLDQGDVIQIAAFGGSSADLTGSLVAANKPVQVMSGHYCANVPNDVRYCDHLEESMLPVQALGSSYAIVPPATPSLLEGKEQVVRFVAVEPNTTLQFEPEQNAPMMLENIGDFIEIAREAEVYIVRADKKLLVLQYMEGQEAGGNSGDPALSQTIPMDQYRDDYLFHAPTNYEHNYVDVIGKISSDIQIDGVSVGELQPIGTSEFGYARVPLSNASDGNHRATSNNPFGVSVYGYGQYTSYWYPGGLNLNPIVID